MIRILGLITEGTVAIIGLGIFVWLIRHIASLLS